MKYIIRFSIYIIFPALLILSGCSDKTSTVSNSAPQKKQPDLLVLGGKLYQKYCSICHGKNGEGYLADNAPMLNNQQFLANATPAFLDSAITKGRSGTPMSAWHKKFGGPLVQDSINILINYIKNWQKAPNDTSSITFEWTDTYKGGYKLYDQYCKACHGEKGIGGLYNDIGHPDFLKGVPDQLLINTIKHGRPGTAMTAFNNILSDREIMDLVNVLKLWEYTPMLTPKETKPPIIPKNIISNPTGTAPNFGELREGRFVSADKVKQAIESKAKMVLLDARPASDYLVAHLPGAIPCPFYDVDTISTLMPVSKDTWVIAYCGCPHEESGLVMDHMRQLGYKNSAVIDEGFLYWVNHNFPVVEGRYPLKKAE